MFLFCHDDRSKWDASPHPPLHTNYTTLTNTWKEHVTPGRKHSNTPPFPHRCTSFVRGTNILWHFENKQVSRLKRACPFPDYAATWFIFVRVFLNTTRSHVLCIYRVGLVTYVIPLSYKDHINSCEVHHHLPLQISSYMNVNTIITTSKT